MLILKYLTYKHIILENKNTNSRPYSSDYGIKSGRVIIWILPFKLLGFFNYPSQKIELKRKVAESFAQQFQLTAPELEALQGDGPVDEKFLSSLERLSQVEDHCRLLLRLPNQSTGSVKHN